MPWTNPKLSDTLIASANSKCPIQKLDTKHHFIIDEFNIVSDVSQRSPV